jgi:multidrug efflux pump subunit AcrA (membrane-fusion protein)
MNKLFSIARSFLSRIFHGEETDEDTGEIFDYEAEEQQQADFEDDLIEATAELLLPGVVSEAINIVEFLEDDEDYDTIIADLEQARADSEQAQAQLDREEIEEEEEEIIFNFPDFVDNNTQEEIYQTLGITDYDDMTDEEKNQYIPGWLGTEQADQTADDDTKDEFEIMNEIANSLNIPPDIAVELGLDTLMQLSEMTDSTIELAREFEMIDPIQIAEELDLDFRMSFDSWSDFVQSKSFDFIMEHPNWFDIDVYYDEDGNLEIDVYEEKGS